MGNYLRIIVEHEEVSYEDVEGFPISIVFSLDAVEDVRRLSGYFTKRGILLTADDVTRRVFGFYEQMGVIDSDDLEFKDFQIVQDGLPILWGRCRLRRVDLTDGEYFFVGKNYYVDFLGNNVTWFEDFKKLKLKDLGFGSHSFTEAVISSKLNVVYDEAGDDYGYMPIKMKNWEEEGKVLWKEFVPFLFIKSILRECFRSVGLEIVSEFFDYEPIERLVMPVFFQQKYSREFFEENTDVRASFSSLSVSENSDNDLIFNDDMSGENFDNGDNYDIGLGSYNIPMAGRYVFRIRFNASFDGTVGGAKIVSFLNGTEFLERPLNVVSGELFSSNLYSDSLNMGGTTTGADLTWKLRLGGHSGTGSISLSNGFLEVEMKEVSNDLGATVNFDFLLRDSWTAGGYILGLKDSFNLMFDTKASEGKVYIEPMDRYVIKWKDSGGVDRVIEGEGYFKVGEKLDKTIDVDLSKKARLISNENSFTEFKLSWKVDSETVESLDSNEDIGVFDAKYLLNEDRHRKGEKKIENKFFAKMLSILDSSVMAEDSSVVPQFPVLWPVDFNDEDGAWLIEDNEDGEGEPVNDFDYDLEYCRILYFAGQRGGIDGKIINENDVGIDMPFGFMVNYNDSSNGDFSLSFGNELLFNGVRSLGLMQAFYMSFLKRMDEGKRFEGNVFWSDIDIVKLDFRRKILLRDVNFLLRKVDGWLPGNDASIKTYMDLDLVQEEGDEDNIKSSSVEGFLGN